MCLAHLEEESTKREGEDETEDPDSIDGVMEEFMVCLAWAVKDAQVEENCCYHCSSPKDFIHDCLLVGASKENTQLNHKEGTALRKGAQAPQIKMTMPKNPPGGGSQGVTQPKQTPFLNLDPFQHCYRVKNIVKVKINGGSCKAFLDNGTQINTITPNYVRNHSLEMGPITDLIGIRVACMSLGNAYTHPLGYIIVWVQVDGVQGYDKDQVALVIPDESKFVEWVAIILGTPTICCVMNVMKEREIDALVMPWANARVAHLLSMCQATSTVLEDQTSESANPNGYNEAVFMRNVETMEAFSSWVISIKAEKAHTGECISVMTQALQTKDGTLPQGLTIQNAYTELWKDSKYVVIVVRNSMAYPQML